MKKNLLVINGLQGGGAEKVCVKLANLLYQSKISVEILVIKNPEGPLRGQLYQDITVHHLDVKRTRNSVFSILSFFKKNKYNSIICFNFQLGILVNLVNKIYLRKTKISLRVINVTSVINKSGLLARVFYELFYNWFDNIIFQCDEMRKDFEGNYSINSDNCKVIYNPCTSISKSSGMDYLVNNIYPKEKIVFAGRLEEQKNIFFMLDSLRFAVDLNPNIVLFLYGEGSLYSSLCNYTTEIGLSENVVFKPFTNDLGGIFNSASLSLLTSKFEGFPNFLLDSISYGVPCLSINCKSGPSEILNDTNGCLVNEYSASVFGENIIRMLSVKWNRDSIAEDAFKRFNEDRFLNSYIEILE